ncbi:hypothetical protein PF008_g11455 [Phytophthora fragariae]|uniref:Uncharacterized protein n=1 Tax=Phytophthora fragariae TaxID=53985 RepID=A0A6G0RSB3_9STRA|nr:hypothetical protein PF008_g11455 [Phytophthora fragariae]
MVGGLDGGSTNPANAHHALGTFVRHAWPQHKDVVMARISLRDADPLRAIARAVDILSEMSETDGRAPSFKKRKMGDGKTSKPEYQPPAKAHLAVVERKHKPKITAKFNSRHGSITCYMCGQVGHTANFHRKYLGSRDSTDEAPARSVETATEPKTQQ